MAKVLAFSGSTRKESFNRKLIRIAARGAEQAGAQVTLLDLKEYPLPLYNGDLESEEGVPDNAMKLKAIFKRHDGLLISSPEYNSGISPLLKNVIDWVSRPVPDEKPLEPYVNKVGGLVAASPGKLGGLRGLFMVRSILSNIKVTVVPNMYALSNAAEAFDDDDELTDDSATKSVESVGRDLAQMLLKLEAGTTVEAS